MNAEGEPCWRSGVGAFKCRAAGWASAGLCALRGDPQQAAERGVVTLSGCSWGEKWEYSQLEQGPLVTR